MLQLSLVSTASVSVPMLPKFAQHNKYPPKTFWLKKCFDACFHDAQFFNSPEASIRLGVTQNMVKAIRHWGTAFKIIESDEFGSCFPTRLGKMLLGSESEDPFLEDPATLWLLHWKLLTPPCYAASWYFVFNRFTNLNFSPEELFKSLQIYKQPIAPQRSDSCLKRDIHCLLQMYVSPNTQKSMEESVEIPFTNLGLIYSLHDKEYNFRVGEKENLPGEIVLYACLEFAVWKRTSSIAVSELAYSLNSPGLAFKLSPYHIGEIIEKLNYPDVKVCFDEENQLKLSFRDSPEIIASKILKNYYKRT